MSVYSVKIHDLLNGEDTARGTKVLVDRVWPRGIPKEDLGHDEWLKGAAPSPELRKWFDHDADKFEEFARRYREELNDGDEDLEKLQQLVEDGDVTLLFAAHDRESNHAVVLKDWLEDN